MSSLAYFGGLPQRVRPFPAWPVHGEEEERALLEVLRSGQWWRHSMGEVAGDGPGSMVARFQEAFAAMHGARYGIACATGTAALEIALKALGVGPGDEVIVPPYTFIATASAPMLIGATPVFCDIDPETWNLDPAAFERAITPRTRAVVPVHFAGLAADMAAIREIAVRRGIAILEDAAHAHGGEWEGRGLGTIGAAGTFSFQASKNMTAGEGGLILTDDPVIAEHCESLVWVGRKVGRPWYEHHRLGWNYRLTEFQAAILLAQLGRLPEQTRRRLDNAEYLNRQLAGVPGIGTFAVPGYATRHAYHLYLLRFDEAAFGVPRAAFLAALGAEGVPCSSGYAFPLYANPLFTGLGWDVRQWAARCPAAEQACREAIWLEHRLLLGDRADMDDIVRAIHKIHECRGAFAAAGTECH